MYCFEIFSYDVNPIEFVINNRKLNMFNIIKLLQHLLLYALEDSLSIVATHMALYSVTVSQSRRACTQSFKMTHYLHAGYFFTPFRRLLIFLLTVKENLSGTFCRV